MHTMDNDRPAPSRRYRVVLHRARGCYFAHVVDFPGCVCRGASEVEAVENARDALRAYLWAMQALGRETPLVELEISA